MTAPQTEQRAPLRECACPPWVIRCAHFGGEWLALHRNTVGDLVICNGFGSPQCRTDIPAHVPGTYAGIYKQARRHPDNPANDLAAANAAFDAAVSRLLAEGAAR